MTAPRRLQHNLQEVIFVPLCIFFYIIATNTESGWLYVLLAVVLGLLVTGWLGPRLQVRGLAIRRQVLEDPPVGGSATVRLELSNRTRRPRQYLLLRDPVPDELQTPNAAADRRLGIDRVDPGTAVTVEYSLPCPRRGVYPLASVTVVSAAPLGLFPASRAYPCPGQVVVVPVGPHLPRLPIHVAVPATVVPHLASTAVGRSHDFAGIREYQPGEDMRFIHWPSTARNGQLMIKEFLDLSSQSVAVLLDTHYSHVPEQFEGMVSAAVSVCEAAHRHNMALTLMVGRGPEVQVLRHPRGPQMLYALAQVAADGSGSPQQWIGSVCAAVPSRSQLFLVTGRAWQAETLAPLLDRRARLSVLLFGCDGEALRSQGVVVYEVDDVRRLPVILHA